MGFYLLNISIDAPDVRFADGPEDLSINDQESIIEIVVEKIFGFENAIAEYDDNDTEDNNNKNNFQKDYDFQSHFDYIKKNNLQYSARLKHPAISYLLTDGFYGLDSPPPKL